MLYLRSRTDIDVPATAAFALLCDAARHAKLNPQITHAMVSVDSGQTLGLGSRLNYRLHTSAGTRRFTNTVVAFEPGHILEFVSDTTPPFRVRMTVEATLYGCNLLHEEWIEPDETVLEAFGRERPVQSLLQILQAAIGYSLTTKPEFDRALYEGLQTHLEQTLDGWLARIKEHLESARSTEPANDSALVT